MENPERKPIKESKSVNDSFIKEKKKIKEQSISDRFSLLYDSGLNKASNLIDDVKIKYELGNGINEYNDKYIQGYSTEKGNYIIEINDFEKKLKNPNYKLIGDEKSPNTINSREFANYLMYLNNKGPLSADLLIKKLGIENTKALIEHWNNKGKTIAKKVLKDAGFEEIIATITDPNLLLSNNPHSEDLNLYTQIIPESHFNRIISEINAGKVDRSISKVFTDKLNQSSCPNPKIIQLVEAIYQREIIDKKKSIINKLKEKSGWNEELTTKLFEKLEESAKNNPCTFDLIKIIDEFNKNDVSNYNKNIIEENKKLKNSEKKKTISVLNSQNTLFIANEVLDFNKQKIEVEKKEILIKLSNNNLKPEDKLKLKNKLEILNEKYVQNTRALITSTNLTTDDVDNIIEMQNKGKTNEEIIVLLRKENKELNRALINFNKNNNSIKHLNNNIETSNIKTFYENNTASLYGNSYRLPLENGGYIEGLTKEEAEITKNPEAAKNLVEFKNILDDLNLRKLWKYRINIFKTLSGPGFSFKNSDYLNKNEIKLFLNSIIISISPDLIKNGDHNIPNESMNLKNYKNKLILLNIGGSFSGTKDVNLSGDSYLEKIFIDNFINRETSTFHFSAFEKAIKN